MKKYVEVYFDPIELAEYFWSESSDFQARFFHNLAIVAGDNLPMQLQHISESPVLSEEAKAVMREIGEYGVKA